MAEKEQLALELFQTEKSMNQLRSKITGFEKTVQSKLPKSIIEDWPYKKDDTPHWLSSGFLLKKAVEPVDWRRQFADWPNREEITATIDEYLSCEKRAQELRNNLEELGI